MNAYTKMVLIPEDEYFKLKASTRDKISMILDRPLPPQMVENQINRQFNDKRQYNPVTLENNDYSDNSFDSADFTWDPAIVSSTPGQKHKELKVLGHKYTPRGRVINSNQKVIPGSNVNRILDYLKNPEPTQPGPSGYKTVARELYRIGEDEAIVNPQGKATLAEIKQINRTLDEAEALDRMYKKRMGDIQKELEWTPLKKF